MPVYEYQCSACDHNFELRQKFSDPPANTCPNCGGEVRKLISSVAFTLKGGGWYAEGYGGGKTTSDPPACPSGGSCAGCPSAAAA